MPKTPFGNNNPKQKKWIIGTIVLVTLIAIAASYFYHTLDNFEEISWKALANMTVVRNVSLLEVVNKEWIRVVMVPRNETINKTIRLNFGSVKSLEQNLENMQHDYNIDRKDYLDIIYTEKIQNKDISRTILVVLVFGWLILMITYLMIQIERSFVASTAKLITPDQITIRFKDVGGCEEAKIEVMEFVSYLKDPEKYTLLGAKSPKGAILTGPPGTGKTLLAKAMAGETNSSFLAVSGSEFNEMYIGVGSARVRNLFKMARKNSPCILFIDEIDSIGRQRDDDRGHHETETTLNQLLAEMDGFNTTANVIVLAATNRIECMDKALLRKGRFDRQIYVPAPDIKGRASIFKLHLGPLKTDVDKEELSRKMASLTTGCTGADIANVCNEAAIIAARFSSESITMTHFEKAIERGIVGIEKKTNVLSPDEMRTIAYHEAGHTVSGWFLQFADPLLKVSILPRGKGLGYSQYLAKDTYLLSKKQLFDQMCVALGGRVSEEIFFGEITTGAQDDLEKLSKSAYAQVMTYGMNEKLGNISFKTDKRFLKPYSEQTSQLIDEEVRLLIATAHKRTKDLIEKHRVDVEKVAESLIENETLNRDDIMKLIGPRPFEDKTTYEQFVEGTGLFEEDTTLTS